MLAALFALIARRNYIAFFAETKPSNDTVVSLMPPKGTVVSYDTVSAAVRKLRNALGDDPRHPHIIETLSKRGYRLIVPVLPLEAQFAMAHAMLAWTYRFDAMNGWSKSHKARQPAF